MNLIYIVEGFKFWFVRPQKSYEITSSILQNMVKPGAVVHIPAVKMYRLSSLFVLSYGLFFPFLISEVFLFIHVSSTSTSCYKFARSEISESFGDWSVFWAPDDNS